MDPRRIDRLIDAPVSGKKTIKIHTLQGSMVNRPTASFIYERPPFRAAAAPRRNPPHQQRTQRTLIVLVFVLSLIAIYYLSQQITILQHYNFNIMKRRSIPNGRLSTSTTEFIPLPLSSGRTSS
jgi:hypothetical protein